MRFITNRYKDAQILNLGSHEEAGPYLVTQTGVSPSEAIPYTHMFVLRPDGRWANFNAYASQEKPEAMDELVFPSLEAVMAVFGSLMGKPQVVDLPVDRAGLHSWIALQNGGDFLAAARTWAAEYKNRRSKQDGG